MEPLLKKVTAFVKENNRYPSISELRPMGFTRDTVRHRYGGMLQLFQAVVENNPNIFDLKYSKLNNKPLTKSRFVITSAVAGDKINEHFYRAIQTYCKLENAELIVIPVTKDKDNYMLDARLKDDKIVVNDLWLNNNLVIKSIKEKATSADPVTGLARIGKRNGSIIVGSTKQRLKFVATGPSKLPHALISTGAVTKPDYDNKSILTSKSSQVADQDHIIGALIVELDKDNTFHFRQVQADILGNFADLGYIYKKNGKKKKFAPEAFVIGDWHAGKTCPVTAKGLFDITKRLDIKTWVMHDVFDGDSISHHDQGKLIVLAKKAQQLRLNLHQELNILSRDLNEISKLVDNVVIVKSNHDEHLDRYLDEGRYIKHPYNHLLCLDLAKALFKDVSPIRLYLDELGPHKGKLTNITWLERDQSYAIAGIQLGAHGDKGANGSRGSIGSLENAYGNVVYGHSHTPEIQRGAWCVGTSTPPSPDYGTGPSSWMNSSCLVYSNGQRQMLNFIDGKCTTKKV